MRFVGFKSQWGERHLVVWAHPHVQGIARDLETPELIFDIIFFIIFLSALNFMPTALLLFWGDKQSSQLYPVLRAGVVGQFCHQ